MKTLLAKLCCNRFVTASPSGMLHHTWGHFTVHGAYLDLVQATECFRQAKAQLGTEFSCGDSRCRVSGTLSKRGDYVTIWLFGVGFCLQPEGFCDFVALVDRAIAHYKTMGDDAVQSLIDAEYPEHPAIFLSLN